MAPLEIFDYFFDLPGELREQILVYLLVKPHGISLGSMPGILPSAADTLDDVDDEKINEEEGAPPWPLNYFLVSQTFNREATAIYFWRNAFHIVATGRKCVPSPHSADNAPPYTNSYPHHGTVSFPAPGEALLNTPHWAGSRRRIRNVVLYVQRPRGSIEKDIFEPLLDMILAGGLKSLDVRICWFSPRGQRMLYSSPMRSLYRVLSDPDLDAVRLRVAARAHEQVWCAFHDGGGDGYKCCRAERVEKLGERHGAGWVDVDVDKLIQTHGDVGDQLRIFKLGD